jgi:uncharacterized peroxidase-related enzyme
MSDSFPGAVIEGPRLETEPVSRFPLGNEANLPPHAAALFAQFRRDYGFVPNWLAALAVNPDTAFRLVTFYHHLFDPKRSLLSNTDRELVAVVTSAVNHCSYCVFNHTQSLGSALQDRVRAQRIALGYGHVRLSDRERALAETAEALTRDPSTVGEVQLDRLRTLGFSEKAILEVLEISAFFNYANRLTIALNVVPDTQFFSN